MNVDVSCLGNHDTDQGIERAEELTKETKIPWVLSNILEKDKGNRLIAGV